MLKAYCHYLLMGQLYNKILVLKHTSTLAQLTYILHKFHSVIYSELFYLTLPMKIKIWWKYVCVKGPSHR